MKSRPTSIPPAFSVSRTPAVPPVARCMMPVCDPSLSRVLFLSSCCSSRSDRRRCRDCHARRGISSHRTVLLRPGVGAAARGRFCLLRKPITYRGPTPRAILGVELPIMLKLAYLPRRTSTSGDRRICSVDRCQRVRSDPRSFCWTTWRTGASFRCGASTTSTPLREPPFRSKTVPYQAIAPCALEEPDPWNALAWWYGNKYDTDGGHISTTPRSPPW